MAWIRSYRGRVNRCLDGRRLPIYRWMNAFVPDLAGSLLANAPIYLLCAR